jgi:hypothetical protein
VQQANGLVRATADGLSIGGWAIAAGLLAFMPITGFFAVNAASFLVSAGLIAGVREHGRVGHAVDGATTAELRAGFAALRPLPLLAAAVAVLGVAITIESGTWMVGVPQLVHKSLGRGAGAFAVVMAGYAVGSISAGTFLARCPIRRKDLGSLLAWALYLPAYLLIGFAGSVVVAFAGAVCAGIGQGSAWVLVNAAAQEQVPDRVLGRVMGQIALVHRGAHATGLLFVSPLFAFFAPRAVFVGAAIAAPVVGLAGLAAGLARREAPARP